MGLGEHPHELGHGMALGFVGKALHERTNELQPTAGTQPLAAQPAHGLSYCLGLLSLARAHMSHTGDGVYTDEANGSANDLIGRLQGALRSRGRFQHCHRIGQGLRCSGQHHFAQSGAEAGQRIGLYFEAHCSAKRLREFQDIAVAIGGIFGQRASKDFVQIG